MAAKTPQIVNEDEIRKSLKEVDATIDLLLPHINKAHLAFGGMEDHLNEINDLKNKVAKARGIYGA